MRTRTKLLSLVLALLLLLITPVTAQFVVDEQIDEFRDTSASGKTVYNDYTSNRWGNVTKFYIKNIENVTNLNYIVCETPTYEGGRWLSTGELMAPGRYEIDYQLGYERKPGVLYIERGYNFLGECTKTKFTFYPNEWSIGELTGRQMIHLPVILFNIPGEDETLECRYGGSLVGGEMAFSIQDGESVDSEAVFAGTKWGDYFGISYTSTQSWSNHLIVEKTAGELPGFDISVYRRINDVPYSSTVEIYDQTGELISANTGHGITFNAWLSDAATVKIISPSGRPYQYTLTASESPGDVMLRKGSVTMTDHNGVTISGFEVTAVNHYTGESYTVSTDTDVADITLPMHRTTEIRNPQTGEYEESPVGYYIFYGQKPGYKMLFDDGIRVRVMPEKYGSYKFCDIGVTSENGFTSTLRRGTVTMTDHNGTAISGFEVTAVNAYTGESHTVSTDTDVAVMDLPMDRTTEIRNPQTGVYEESPVGYYRFFGQAPGYKMLKEEGIKASVMPQKYGSYKLCDILVTGESGPLSGKHQFQIRSRGDNSVLQTGTVSAQSETTGIWYNTTLTNGIATLLLPYDTSDALSEYAGHYYVYATSPGYVDSDYGTRIIVSPRTALEIKTILLTPIGGVPTPGNVTLRIEAFSETGQDVPKAEIFIAGVLGAGKDVWDTYTASSTGYLEVSVPGNSTYDIVARGAGYYDSSRRIEVFTEDPELIEIRLYLSGAPTVEPTTEPTGWPTGPPTTQPTGGIPDEDDDSDGFMVQAVRSIANLFGVSFGIGKTILGMLIALAIGTATAKQLKGGAQEFGMGMLGGVVLGVLIGLLPIWVLVLLLLIIGLWIGYRYMSGGDS